MDVVRKIELRFLYLAVGGIGALPSKEGSACSSRVEVGVLHLDLLLALDPLHSMTSSRLTLASSPLGHGQVLAHVTCGSPLGSADWWIEHQPQVQHQPPESPAFLLSTTSSSSSVTPGLMTIPLVLPSP